jgi:hypothetical protein
MAALSEASKALQNSLLQRETSSRKPIGLPVPAFEPGAGIAANAERDPGSALRSVRGEGAVRLCKALTDVGD